MMFLDRLGTPPRPFDQQRLKRAWQTLEEAGCNAGSEDPKWSMQDPRARSLLDGVFGNSPYLTRLILKNPPVLAEVLTSEPEQLLGRLIARTQKASAAQDLDSLMSALRREKQFAALLTALCDVGGVWAIGDVTEALSRFADAAIGAAVQFLLAREVTAGRLQRVPDAGSGLIVLAMGKYGAYELNYSSDVDLIIFFDKARFLVNASFDAQQVAVRITQALVRVLSQPTADGYVFRADLRLRPDAGATQVALSTDAAEIYYESMGQNWERAAMIKARPCAGDLMAGEQFLSKLKPYMWRRHLDYAAIEDIHSIKRQIHLHKGHGKIAIGGHNIKLGRGGIREIEFFVQTQQLIMGGREPKLRGRTTLGMLSMLAELKFISEAAAAQLKPAYEFLRKVEHRLQMVEDEQTHTLPTNIEDLRAIACFCGFDDLPAFENVMRSTLETVQAHYAALFEHAPTLTEESGSLVFTGVEDDPETLLTLAQMGFARARDISAMIRSWHHGRLRATRSARARELLTTLVPVLLAALARTGDPDGAFIRFNQFIEGLPAGVQLFSMLMANHHLLDMLAQSFGSAPRLASYLAQNSAVIDAMLDPSFFTVTPDCEMLEQALDHALLEARDDQDVLDAVRRFAREQNFRVGFQLLNGTIDAVNAGIGFSNVAEAVIRALFARTELAFCERYGRIAGGSVMLLAMGKLGGREMSVTSDLDLIFIYDGPDEAVSDGPRALSAPDYYARFAQRLINALTVPTSEGKLYDVDMQLRPSGNAGPLATRLKSFIAYQNRDAWTWEHMALTCFRPIAGDEALKARVARSILTVLTVPRDPRLIARDVVEMRAKIQGTYPSDDCWELKYVRGGLIDLEFIAQYLELVHSAASPQLFSGNSRIVLKRLCDAGILTPAVWQGLEAASALIQSLNQILRVALAERFDSKSATPGLAALLCRASGQLSLNSLEERLQKAEREIFTQFRILIEDAQ